MKKILASREWTQMRKKTGSGRSRADCQTPVRHASQGHENCGSAHHRVLVALLLPLIFSVVFCLLSLLFVLRIFVFALCLSATCLSICVGSLLSCWCWCSMLLCSLLALICLFCLLPFVICLCCIVDLLFCVVLVCLLSFVMVVLLICCSVLSCSLLAGTTNTVWHACMPLSFHCFFFILSVFLGIHSFTPSLSPSPPSLSLHSLPFPSFILPSILFRFLSSLTFLSFFFLSFLLCFFVDPLSWSMKGNHLSGHSHYFSVCLFVPLTFLFWILIFFMVFSIFAPLRSK